MPDADELTRSVKRARESTELEARASRRDEKKAGDGETELKRRVYVIYISLCLHLFIWNYMETSCFMYTEVFVDASALRYIHLLSRFPSPPHFIHILSTFSAPKPTHPHTRVGI